MSGIQHLVKKLKSLKSGGCPFIYPTIPGGTKPGPVALSRAFPPGTTGKLNEYPPRLKAAKTANPVLALNRKAG
jgi:hypothetical protein